MTTYVVTLQVQLERTLDLESAAELAALWADQAVDTLDDTMTGLGPVHDEPVLRVAGRLDDGGPIDSVTRRMPATLEHLLRRHGVELAAWLEVSVLSLAEFDRQAKARAAARTSAEVEQLRGLLEQLEAEREGAHGGEVDGLTSAENFVHARLEALGVTV